jgi:hypothetical protein
MRIMGSVPFCMGRTRPNNIILCYNLACGSWQVTPAWRGGPRFLEHFAGIVRLSLSEMAGFAGENAGAGQISLTKL